MDYCKKVKPSKPTKPCVGSYNKIILLLLSGSHDFSTFGPLHFESHRAVHLPCKVFWVFFVGFFTCSYEIWLVPSFEKENVENIPNLCGSEKKELKKFNVVIYSFFLTTNVFETKRCAFSCLVNFLKIMLVRICTFVDTSFIYEYLLILVIVKGEKKRKTVEVIEGKSISNIFLSGQISQWNVWIYFFIFTPGKLPNWKYYSCFD